MIPRLIQIIFAFLFVKSCQGNAVSPNEMNTLAQISEHVTCSEDARYLADPIDCRYYINCIEGIPYRVKCVESLYWNQDFQMCVLSSNHCGSIITGDNIILNSERTAFSTKPKQIRAKFAEPLLYNALIRTLNESTDSTTLPDDIEKTTEGTTLSVEITTTTPEDASLSTANTESTVTSSQTEEPKTTTTEGTTSSDDASTFSTSSNEPSTTTSETEEPITTTQRTTLPVNTSISTSATTTTPSQPHELSTTATPDNTTVTEETTDVITTTTTVVTTTEKDNSICSDGLIYHQDPHDCRYFIVCSNGIPYRLKCPSSLFWNQNILSCDRSDKHCNSSGTTPTTTPTAIPTTVSTTVPTTTPTTDTTTAPTTTPTTTPTTVQTTVSTTGPTTIPTTTPTTVTTTSPTTVQTTVSTTVPTTIPTTVPTTTPTTVPTTVQTTVPTTAPTTPTTAPTTPTTIPTTLPTTVPTTTPTTEPTTVPTTTPTTLPTTGPIDKPNSICSDGLIYHQDPYDCHYFIKCANGIPYRFKCPSPLFWNQSILSCTRSGEHCNSSITTPKTLAPTTMPTSRPADFDVIPHA
ncbi:mucin-2-like [Glossina fuscipes]|uniref:Mucin-2-like n=1 Tax=Glossina fuscipes TaxID=7396 RepID=A0A9C5ZKS3_9MUSC|nr:mucin-2-like [Glossina fuscipes]